MTNGKQSIGRMKAKSMPNQQEDSTNKRYSFDRIDMRDAPITEHVYGRDIEVGTLEQWIQDDHCRVVALVGLGGIGKTTLAELVTKHIKDHFDYVFWYSLLHAPPPSIFLERCIRFLSNQEEIFLPSSIDDQIQLLSSEKVLPRPTQEGITQPEPMAAVRLDSP